MLWEISDDNWKSVLRGLEKTKIKFMIASAVVFNPEQPWYTLNIMCMIITMSVMTVFVFIGSMSIYLARKDLLTFVEIAHAYSFIVALWGLLLLQFTTKVPTVYELLRLIDTDVFVYKTVHGREDVGKIKLNMKKFSNIFQNLFHTALVLAVSMLVVVTPLLLNIFGEGDRPKIKGINYKLPIPFWFPFNTDTRTGFTVAYLLLTGEIVLVIFYIGVALPFIVYLALEVGVQFKILHDSILNVEPRAIERYRSCKYLEDTEDGETLGEDPLFQMCVRECLKENVLHHIQIIRISWRISKEDWERIERGIEKTGVKFLIGTALVISPQQPWLTYNLITLTVTFLVMTYFLIVGLISMYLARNDLVAFVDLVHAYTFASSLWALILIHQIFKVPSLHAFLKMIDAGIFEYKTEYGRHEFEKLKKAGNFYKKVFQKIFNIALIVAFIALSFVAPTMTKIYGGEERKKAKELNYDLPVPCWMPFNTEAFPGFVIAYILLLVQFSLISCVILAAVPILFYGAVELSIQFKILKISIANLELRAVEKYRCRCEAVTKSHSLRSDPLYERCLQESLNENVLHHIEILRFYHLYQEMSSVVYGLLIGMSMAMLASLTLVLTKTKLLSFETIKFAIFFVLELIIIFGYCLMGTFLTDVSKEISSALYNTSWYNLSENLKKTLRIFQLNSEVGIVLKGNGIFVINLELFVQFEDYQQMLEDTPTKVDGFVYKFITVKIGNKSCFMYRPDLVTFHTLTQLQRITYMKTHFTQDKVIRGNYIIVSLYGATVCISLRR
ncbi:hypothetical protein LSTR_LSTR007955 [Laodelphax striatellus]|uniref:Odorant receptor n=1 Tax=Laodelphax striatellus TaxID=195883 RepID=A0A482XFM2_LAOST|nr:hypothetical protein LSTR_LSTR007955 [Laodelphax striatellus]